MSFTFGKFVREHEGVTLLAAFAFLLVVHFALRPPPSIRGGKNAHSDVACGHYVLLEYGLLAEWSSGYQQCLRERYGVESRTVAGCTVTESELAYYQSYNVISTTAVNQKFGRDVFEECADFARMSWDRTHSTAKQN